MNIKTLKKVLPCLLDSGVTPWVWGHHGKGKTETIETFCKERGWLVFNFRLNTQADVGDFLGLQDFTTDDSGKKVATSFFMPDWLKKSFDFCKANPDKKAVIFIDEINRAARMDLIGPVFQMALDGRLHTYEFPQNLRIICASNPDTGDYSGILTLSDKALLSRFCHIYFNPDVNEWREYAVKKNYSVDILDFISEHPEFLEERNLENFSIKEFATPDRRKYSAIQRLMDLGLPKDEYHEVFSGLIGLEAATAYVKFLDRDDKPLSIEQILDEYPAHAGRIKKYAKSSRTDLLHNASQKVIDHVKQNKPITEAQCKNIFDLMFDMPVSILFNMAHSIYTTQAIYSYCENNPPYKKKLTKALEEARNVTAKAKDNEESDEIPF